MKRILILVALATLIGNGVVAQATPLHTEAGIIGVKEVQVKQLNKVADTISEPTSTGKFKPEPVKSVSVPVSGAKAFIYQHESGNNPASINASSGACGLGQALPCSKMPCSLSDYACQDAYFTSYMASRYGTWENAMAFWQANHWW